MEYWEKARSKEEFVRLVLSDISLMPKQFYGELSKRESAFDHADRVIRMIDLAGAKHYTTYADAGSVLMKSMDGSCSVQLPNGLGDGKMIVAIFDDETKFFPNMMNFTGVVVNGQFRIMAYDCDMGADAVYPSVAEISGSYFVYNYDGIVALVRFA